MANREARRAAHQTGEQMDLRAWKYEKKSRRREEWKTSVTVRWQRDWDEGKTGRPLHDNCREVGLDDVKYSFKMVQFLTGHGNVQDYLRRETIEHVRFQCHKVGTC